MTPADLFALSPLLVLSGTAVSVMLGTALGRRHRRAAAGTAGGLALAIAAIPAARSCSPGSVTALLSLDRFAYFYIGLVLAGALAVSLLSYGYLDQRKGNREEFYVLLLLATLGSAVLAAGSHFASFFLGLELLTVSLYALIAYSHSGDGRPVEAGLKYLVLAAASSAFLLFGMALVYARFGQMEFAKIGASVAGAGAFRDPYVLLGSAMILTGAGFKLAVVPFHMWTPDVYEGAPAPVTAFVATVSKGAVFALLLRYFSASGAYGSAPVVAVVWLIAVASMIAGNLLALLQDNVKRMLAYSSIAHLGYLLVAFLAGGSTAGEAATFYLVAYFATTIIAFGVVAACSGAGRDADRIDDYRGMFWRRPWLAGAFTAALFSLAGIPLTAGFLGKFYVVAAGVGSGEIAAVLVLAAGSAVGLYYYLRVIIAMFSRDPGADPGSPPPDEPPVPLPGRIVLAGLTILLFALGVFPSPWMRLIREAVASLLPGP